MEKTIKVGDQKLRLSNNVGWVLAYRDQFGRDVLPAIMPALWSLIDIASGAFAELEGKRKISYEDVITVLSGDAASEAYYKLSGLEFADFVNIVWAMAKAADDDIEEPKEWLKQFEVFPVDVIGPEVFGLVTKGLVSSKNLERLRSVLRTVTPESSEQTPSSSPDSNEA